MIALHGFSASLHETPVLHDIDFTASAGEFVALCGPNGAGKTTFLKALAGILPGGKPQPSRIAYVEQNARSAWGLTVRQVAALGRTPHRDDNHRAIDRALEACGVASLAHRRIDRISGGQARRAMLARALATEPEILLLDEPVADLDPAAAHDIMALLAEFVVQGRIVIASLHAVELALRYASRMVVLQGGRIRADDTPLAAMPVAAACFGLDWGFGKLPGLLPWGEAGEG